MTNKFEPLGEFIGDKIGQERQEGFKERELMEIKFALMYDEEFDHGTDGHSRLKLIAKLARFCIAKEVKTLVQNTILEPYEG